MSQRVRRISLLAALAYIPLLASAPGRVPGDTKLYLYLDPGRLISDSIWSWDARQLGGWVPHQNVGYLWPSGPFYAGFDWLGVPDWITHRLWTGSLLLLAGLGVLWLARVVRLSPTAGLCAAILYQLSPYVLPYISRTSALLLPWALLGWLIGVTIRIAERRDPRMIGVFGLLIASTGGLNATALLMIAPAPIIWFVATSRGQSWRRIATTLAILGVVGSGASAWWLAGLRVQGSNGAAVLSYSETLVSTAATSSSIEVLRGLGYWLFYDRNHVVALTSAATPYMGNLFVIAAGFSIVVLGLRGLRWMRTEVRRPLVVMLLVGAVLAIGPYPFDDPSPLWSPATDNPTSALSLALRSSTRAVPLVILALVIGAGLSLERLTRHRRRAQVVAPALALVIAVVNLPALVGGRLVDPVMERPNDLPSAWYDVADYLDARVDAGFTGSVLLVPGIESAAYRWGYTVDPILPGLTKKRLLGRDWLPLGSAPHMDLLYALDDAFQNGDIDPAAVAPVARLLGADTVMIVNSHQYERFGTISPARTASLALDRAAGLTHLADFGSPTVNTSPYWSVEDTLFPAPPLPEISLYAVEDASSADRVLANPTVVLADGTGLVDIAPLVSGPVLTTAALDEQSLERALASAPDIVITDSNRKRAHHWRSSQEVWGATEPLDGVISTADVFDQRLPVFPDQTSDDQTIVATSDITARATAYGFELTYRPESRPSMAVDGDPTTAWVVGERRDPRGQIITLDAQQPIDVLELVPADSDRRITRVSVRIDGGPWSARDVDGPSNITLDPPGRVIDVRIDDVSAAGTGGVGWSEMIPAERSRAEFVRVPLASSLPTNTAPTSWIFTRLTADSVDPWRSDPETAIRRLFDSPREDSLAIAATVRVDARASSLLPDVTASSVLSRAVLPWHALDGDDRTAWFPAIGDATPSLVVPALADEVSVRLTVTDRASLRARVDDIDVEVTNRGDGRFDISIPTGARAITLLPDVSNLAPRRDSRTGDQVVPPVGIAEIVGSATIAPDQSFSIECRDDVLTLDDRAIALSLSGTLGDVLNDRALAATSCGDPISLGTGDHRLEARPGHQTGWHIDQIVLRSAGARFAPAASRDSDVVATVERAGRTYTVPPCPVGCWLETRDGWNTGWSASIDGTELGRPIASGGGRTTWWLDPSDTTRTVEASWAPQRTLWFGLGLSLFTVLLCCGLALWPSRRRDAVVISTSTDDDIVRDSSPRRLALTTVAVTAFVVGPLWAIVPLVLVRKSFSTWARRIGIALIVLAGLFVIAQQIRTGADPGFGWPSVFRRAHRPALLGLVLVTMGWWGQSNASDSRRRMSDS